MTKGQNENNKLKSQYNNYKITKFVILFHILFFFFWRRSSTVHTQLPSRQSYVLNWSHLLSVTLLVHKHFTLFFTFLHYFMFLTFYFTSIFLTLSIAALHSLFNTVPNNKISLNCTTITISRLK